MPHAQTRPEAAAALAHAVAPGLATVLLTLYPDADTLDTLRPGQTDLAEQEAVTRAVADAMLEAGVEIVVQRADRAAFRRFMAGRADTAENRLAWVDRDRLLRGPAALQALGLPPAAAPPPERFPAAPGPTADHLLDAYADDESDEFDALVQALLQAGRTDILDLAVRKLEERQDDAAADELDWVLLVAAEGAACGPSGWAELVALPVALSTGALPDGAALIDSLLASGALDPQDELRLLPGWRSPDALAGLSFGAVRRVLRALAAGEPPQDLPPGDTDDLARSGFGVLFGLRIDWTIPVWDAIEAAGGLPDAPDDALEDDEPESPEDARRAALFDQWRGTVFQDSQGCVPLALVAFSAVADEIAEFLAEAGEQTRGLDDIRNFVAAARAAAGAQAVFCRVSVEGDELGLMMHRADGVLLDAMRMPANRLPAPPAAMIPLIETFVRVVQD